MNTKLIFKSIVMTLLIPGSAIILVPYFILGQSGITNPVNLATSAILPIIIGIIGIVVLLHCIWRFAIHGIGTLAPIDPPKQLVVQGLYRYNRNPMYIAVVLVLLSEALLFESSSLLIYAIGIFLSFHLFFIFYEEPHLRSQFGKFYEEYFDAVPRWTIALKAFKSNIEVPK
jgi:protein-S-isoprenylcysteine O-methyltransferase Ste14